VLAVAAYGLRFLDLDGAILAGLFGGSIIYFGDWTWLTPALAFFIPASLASIWASKRGAVRQQRGHRRDAVQVFANGAPAWTLVILHGFIPIPDAYWLFAGAFSAAAADTLATEIGTALRGATRSIVTGRRVEPGTSGGISVAGSLAALTGAAIVAAAASAARPESGPLYGGLLVVAGFLGAMIDSFLGATLQVRYRDAAGRVTEHAFTYGQPNTKIGGLSWVTNDTVNFFCTAAGMAITGIGSWFLVLGS
jgi:uncharacterized protein (TIGR00297 family)